MPVAAGAAAVSWIGATGATAAVVGAAVAGAVTGAIIGAGVALVTGENPLKGALKGALIGGVSGGVLKGVGLAVNAATTTAADAAPVINSGTEATSTLANANASLSEMNGIATTASQAAPAAEQGLLSKSWSALTGGGGGTPLTDAQTIAKSNVQSGIFGGLAKGVADYGASMATSNEAKELAEWKEKQIELNKLKGADLPDFTANTTSLALPDRWNANLKKQGLLS